ncbi:MAG: bifunctional (p)ppGpp synthetase/guanosine-3',5'-bis(diphosphate) 3'-pyrophosphohydrolase [Alphaproteobacteria bacterium]|nr:bifunctional (p)ppGpp synthetase/guanosine-3',5'-bis(diphosphate) 3'-pyrophosphohydrolase [Alphaproteobacteria bacterium]
MLRQFELVERVKSYDPTADEDGLNRAYVFAVKMHGSQKRESGDPYFSHPVEVAGILTEYKLDYATIVTALLHDTMEDTAASHEDIEKLFGSEVAFLVEGVTKLSKIQAQSEHNKQAENFRKLVLAMSEDIRVLLIKLADRLHNMRTLHFCKKEEKRLRIARETLDIYAPLAERLGMNKMKDELEDLAFQQLHPEAYQSIISRLNFLREKGGDLIERIVQQLEEDVREIGDDADVYGREKRPYSIWRKMQRQNISFEQICDIMAFRVVVPTVADCYHVLGIIHTKYPMIPGRYKDYISTPKSNGYQSLHTGVIGPVKQRIEVQIRTRDMHEVAELGVAAHWEYKQNMAPTVDGKKFRWMRELLDLLNDSSNSDEFLENTKISMYNDQIFCFTPKGDLFNLPKDATAIDFAYAVHSNVGDRCVGVKINGEIRPLRTILQNGDQVEILTSKTQTPSPEWERFVVTAKAKAAIRRFIRNQKRTQFTELGKSLIQNLYKENKVAFNDKEIEAVLTHFKKDSLDDLYVMMGEGIVLPSDVFYKIHPEKRSTLQRVVEIFKRKPNKINKSEKNNLIKGLVSGIALHYSRCCHPVPGDKIVGIVTTGKGVAIHKADCNMLKKYAHEPERWLDIEWNDNIDGVERLFPVRVRITVADKPNALATISTAVSKAGSNISHLFTTEKSTGFMELSMDVDIKNTAHLEEVIAALKALPVVVSLTKESN